MSYFIIYKKTFDKKYFKWKVLLDVKYTVFFASNFTFTHTLKQDRHRKPSAKTFSTFLKIFETLRVVWWNSKSCFVLLPEWGNEIIHSPSGYRYHNHRIHSQTLCYCTIRTPNIHYIIKFYLSSLISFSFIDSYAEESNN